MNIDTLNLKETDLKTLKPIGFGTDGTVYSYKNNTLIKLYHQRLKQIIIEDRNDNDVKIYNKNKVDGKIFIVIV